MFTISEISANVGCRKTVENTKLRKEWCGARVFIAQCLLGRRVPALSASLNVRAIVWTRTNIFSIYCGVIRIIRPKRNVRLAPHQYPTRSKRGFESTAVDDHSAVEISTRNAAPHYSRIPFRTFQNRRQYYFHRAHKIAELIRTNHIEL